VKLVDSGGIQLGMITMGVGLQAWNVSGDWTNGKQFRNMRALFPMYDTPFQAAVLRRSGIASLAQLDKKRIGGGPRGGTSGTYVPKTLKVLGIAAEISHGSRNDMLARLLTSNDDAFLAVIGAPCRRSRKQGRRSRSHSSIFLPNKSKPSARRCRSSALRRSRLERTASWRKTVSLSECIILRLDEPISRTIWFFQNQPRLVKAHPAASETLPQNVDKNTFLPFHPGAVRYYREIGISIPKSLIPTN
jgi:TRAP-type uncharacterized transport system substrate-binding protein